RWRLVSGRGLGGRDRCGDRRSHHRRRNCVPDPRHQPRTCATRQSFPFLLRVSRSSLIDRMRTSETLAVTWALVALPRTTFRTRALGTLPCAGRRGGSDWSALASCLVAVAAKAASVFALECPTS